MLRLLQIQSICRRQNDCESKIEIGVGKDRKHCWKRRKCWLPAFSPFPTMFSKAFFSRGVKKSGLCGKGLSTQSLQYLKNFFVLSICILLDIQVCSKICKYVCFRINQSSNPFQNKPLFLRVCSTSLLKAQREKEKLLVTVFSTYLENFAPFSTNLKL